MPKGTVPDTLAKMICKQPYANILCMNLLFQFTGHDPEQLNKEIVPVFMGHFPAGASSKQLIHFAQGIDSNEFRRYDHGPLKNIFMYGQKVPPKYNFTEISCRIIMHYSQNDYLSNVEDVKRIARHLPRLVEFNEVEYQRFNHLDYLMARDVKTLLYDKIIEDIIKYTDFE